MVINAAATFLVSNMDIYNILIDSTVYAQHRMIIIYCSVGMDLFPNYFITEVFFYCLIPSCFFTFSPSLLFYAFLIMT